MKNRALLLLSISLSLTACDAAPMTSDAGSDASTTSDASTQPDSGSDAGGPCVRATLQSFRLVGEDDVSISFRARIRPDIELQPWDLYLEINRFATEYVGEFPLGEGQDANYGGCARCVVAFYGTGGRDHGFFARSGTLVLRQDPFSYRLDATLRDVVLEEVTIGGDALESTPVPDGACIALETTEVSEVFAPMGWRCPPEQYRDGEACNCSCGLFDPDCGERCGLPPDPSCDPTPLPIVGCASGDLCTSDTSECAARCDTVARTPCSAGYCAMSLDGDRCYDPSDEPADPAAIGERCEPADRSYACAVDAEGFARGLCDPDADWQCRAACASDADCTVEGETCSLLFGDPDAGTARGYCAVPPPPCLPSGEPCTDHLQCCTVLCEGSGTCA